MHSVLILFYKFIIYMFLLDKFIFLVILFSNIFSLNFNRVKNFNNNKINLLNNNINILDNNYNSLLNNSNINLSVIGLSHINNTIDIIEKIKFNEDDIINIRRYMYLTNISHEINFLSTCNRFEIYLISNNNTKIIEILLDKINNINNNFKYVKNRLIIKHDDDAIIHLLRVSTGLESLVLGENQILHQIKKNHQELLKEKKIYNYKYLPKLFEYAIICGKKTRTLTNIYHHDSSIPSIAINLAKNLGFNNSSNDIISIIGCGKMTKLLLNYLNNYSIKNIYLINRDVNKAIQLKNNFKNLNITTSNYTDFEIKLIDSDYIFVATSSQTYLITPELFYNKCLTKKIKIIDISLPRNVDPECSNNSNINLYNIDDLKNIQLNKNNDIFFVENIIMNYYDQFNKWIKFNSIYKNIDNIKNEIENEIINKNNKEIYFLLNNKHNLTEKDIDNYNKFIINKIFNKIYKNIK